MLGEMTMYFYSREQVRKACQILDNYLRVHASERLALPYEKVCSQTDQEEFKEGAGIPTPFRGLG